MKAVITILVAFATLGTIGYLCGAFYGTSFNIADWSPDTRLGVVLFIGTTMTLSIPGISIHCAPRNPEADK